jgi:hypothetical protein
MTRQNLLYEIEGWLDRVSARKKFVGGLKIKIKKITP